MRKKPDARTTKPKGSPLKKEPAVKAARPKKASSKPAKKPVLPAALPTLEPLGELPRSYGENLLFLVAQEPHWLFTYWDIDISHHPGGQTFLRVYTGESSVEAEIEVPFETRNWYIPVKNAGARYLVEIGYHRGTAWHAIARSAAVQTPPDQISDQDSFAYATIPLHISFQKLTESLETAMQAGETAVAALGRLQKEGKLSSLSPSSFSSEDRSAMEALLGKKLLSDLSSGAFSSEALKTRIREHLKIKLHSEGTSELLERTQWGGTDSLPRLLESLSSAALSSWGAFVAGSETLASWSQTPQAAGLSSWLQAGQSSWAGAALSSWNQAAITSWGEAAVTSWGGASENLSSFGQQREFFMHVNAEVIFYGGTDPRAKVTIDGKPVTLNPDGTFRHHFIFPDGTYEIPIVAVSPDGVETRGALLRFDRNTQRQGKVDATVQPPLGAPMGAKT